MILDITTEPGLSALYAAFLSFVTVVLSFATWWLSTLKQRLESKKTHKAISSQFDEENPDALIHKIKFIESELKTNGGSSVKDMVIKCSSDVKKISASQKVRTEMLMNLTKDCLFTCDESGEVIFANDAMKQLYGMSEIMGYDGLKAVTAQSERQRLRNAWADAVRDKIVFRDECEIMNQLDRKRIRIEIQITPVWDDDDNFIQFNGFVKVKEHAGQ